ncbi:hypothetical protein HYV80_06420 [Candidatus Woesearchaeota archaeon]|nr:hypothetical protein [Candidatus Woesearchaeota archaeon]
MGKTARRILIGSAAFVFTGLVHRILEDEILRLKSLKFISETAAERAKTPDDRYIHQKRSEYYGRLAIIAETIQSINPFSIPSHLRNVYNNYSSKKHYEAGKS